MNMLIASGLPYDGWIISINKNVVETADAIFSDNQADVRILATICFIMKDLPICFTDIHLLYFRRNITLALYENSSIL